MKLLENSASAGYNWLCLTDRYSKSTVDVFSTSEEAKQDLERYLDENGGCTDDEFIIFEMTPVLKYRVVILPPKLVPFNVNEEK